MTDFPENDRLLRRAFWLVKLRWVATASVATATFISATLLDIALAESALYTVAVLLAVYNAGIFIWLNRCCSSRRPPPLRPIEKLISFQIFTDLLILTVLLHFSGGVENPFALYFIFHMILASILLSVRQSYLQATFAAVLFGLLVLLEHLQVIPHHCLVGFVATCQSDNALHVFGIYFVFTSAMYLVVYMTGDISMRLKQAEQAHRLTNIQLLEKDRVKDEYVARVSHDITGHLATIQNCLDMLLNDILGPLNPKQLEFVGRAHKRVKHLLTFARSLLKLTRMRLTHTLETTAFPLIDTISDAIAAVEPKAADKSITLKCRLELSDEMVMGDALSLQEVITHLLFNAIDYTPSAGTVTVTAAANADQLSLEIADNGIGIPKDELPKIFDEFYRATNAKQVEKYGTGLGLSIAKQVIERHHGQITVHSSQGQGTSFTITLPKTP